MLFYISICAFERGVLLSEQQHVQHMQIPASPGPTYTLKTKKIKKTISNKHVKRTCQTHLNFIQDNGAGEEERKRREEEEDAEEEEEE